MKMRLVLPVLALFYSAILHAGEDIPEWLSSQLPNRTVLTIPGVYPLADGKLLGVGEETVHESLRDSQAARMVLNSAERDAKRRIAKHLYPELFNRHKSVAVDARHIQRVFEQPASASGKKASVAIVVDAADISARPVLNDSVILEARRIVIPSSMLTYLQDPLLQLGGCRIFSREDGWIAVGVGLAPLFGNDSLAERDAMKRARLEAGKHLTGAIFGIGLDVLEEDADTREELDGVVRMREWSSKRTRETVEGELRRAVELGHWFTDDEHVAVVVAVSNPPLEDISALPDESLPIPNHADWDVDEKWDYALLNRPGILRGGATFVYEMDALWSIGVGAGKLIGNPANDRINAPRSAEMDARRNIVKLLSGFSSASLSEEVEELVHVLEEGGGGASSVVESL